MTDVTAADLSRVPLFAGLPAAELGALAGASVRRRLADGDALFVQGEPARNLYVVVAGSVVLRAEDGGQAVIVETLQPGSVVGWSAMRDGAMTLSTGRASGRAEVIVVPTDPIVEVVTSGSEGGRMLFRRIIGLAAGHLDDAWKQLLRQGREGVISAG